MRIATLSVIWLGLAINILMAQEYSKGMLRMEVVKIKLNGDDAPMDMGSALGNVSVKLFSDGKRQKSEFSMMMMNSISFTESASDSVHIYMDMMGTKYLIADTRSQIKANGEKSDLKEPSVNITEFRNETKEILGYPCYKVNVKMGFGEEKTDNQSPEQMNMVLYVTDQLRFDPSFVTQNKHALDLKGTPLEYNMEMGGGSFKIELTIQAKEIRSDISEDDFKRPAGRYKVCTMESFQNELSQMKR